MTLSLHDELEAFLTDRKVSSWGFSTIPLPHKIWSIPEHLSTAITIVIRLSDDVVDEIHDEPTITYFHHYRTVNYFIDQTQLGIGLILQKHAFSYMPIPASQSDPAAGTLFSGRFSHKEAAVRAGLGNIGRSALFLHNEYGPRVRLGTVFTNWQPGIVTFEEKKERLSPFCEHCDLCIRSCPAGALHGKKALSIERDELLDPAGCSAYMKNEFQHIGRGAVCGICMRVCPAGRRL